MSKRRRTGTRRAAGTPVTAARLRRGWSGPKGTRIRAARQGEADHIDQVVRHTGTRLEPAAAAAIDDGTLGTAFAAALDQGESGPMIESLVQALARGDVALAFPALSVCLVAVDPADRVVAALLGIPPGNLMRMALDAGVNPYMCLTAGFSMAKIKSLAVDEPHRGAGIGGGLLRRAVGLYLQLGVYLVYGQFPPGRGLETYYPRHGFDVLDHGAGISMEAQFGVPLVLGAEPGSREQLFVRWRGNPDRRFWEVRA